MISFYTQNYYTLKRIKGEDDFVLFLNQNENVKQLVKVPLKKIKDKLYEYISFGEINKIDSEKIPNEKIINSSLQIILSGCKLYEPIKNNKAVKKLFTDAYLRLSKRLFQKDGYNDEEFLIQTHIQYWLQDNLAELIAEDYRFSSFTIIKKLLVQSEMLDRFLMSFQYYIPEKWIVETPNPWIEVSEEYSTVLSYIKTIERDYFKEYEKQLKDSLNMSPWKCYSATTRGEDYYMLNTEFSFRNKTLFVKNINLWLRFWDNLKLPFIQKIVFYIINSPTDYILVAKKLNEQKEYQRSSSKLLAIILLNKLFESMIEAQNNLAFYDERIKSLSEFEKDEELIKQGQIIYLEWAKLRKNVYRKIFKELSNILSYNEISEWIYSYRKKSVDAENKYNKPFNDELELIINSFNSFFSKIPIKERLEGLYQNFNLPYFNDLMRQKQILKTDTKQADEILKKLAEFINSDNFYWDKSLSEMYWSSMKYTGVLLSLCEDPINKAFEIIDQFKATNEGWNISEINFKIFQRESYILCGTILLLEHKKIFITSQKRKQFFEHLLNHLISQIRFNSYVSEDYLLPIFIISLFVNQLCPSYKSKFEKEIINGIDDCIILVKVMVSDDYKITAYGKNTLLKRIDTEFSFIKRKLLQKGQKSEVEKIELMISELRGYR